MPTPRETVPTLSRQQRHAEVHGRPNACFPVAPVRVKIIGDCASDLAEAVEAQALACPLTLGPNATIYTNGIRD